ncbi:MAG: hypothetical protein LBV61_06845 [Burkholderiaceae bacterium]|nr:hypothetical protein [Burkholderiaceae bacterium]
MSGFIGVHKLIDRWVGKKQINEILSFIHVLSTMTDEDIAELDALVAHTRNDMLEAGDDVLFPRDLWLRKPKIINETLRLAMKLRAEGDTTTAAAFSVWAYTLRAAARPALLPIARLMWRELSRGFPHLRYAETMTLEPTGVKIGLLNADKIPQGFESPHKKTAA